MSNNDNELMRRFQALRGTILDTQSEIASSSAQVLRREQQQRSVSQPVSRSALQTRQQQLPVSQPVLRPVSQMGERRPQQQQPKKKKSRGNRKLQRYRAKLRKQGLNDEEIRTLINNYNNTTDQGDAVEQSTVSNMDVELLIPIRDQPEALANNNVNNQTKPPSKRKRETTRPTTGVTTSISEISLSNLPRKRARSTTRKEIIQQKTEKKGTSDHKPKYLKVPDKIFKEMLSKSLSGTESIIQWLDTPEKLTFIRTFTHLLNNVFYLKLEQDFWEYYYQLCMAESIGSSVMDKNIAKENNLYRFKFKTKVQLEKHRQLILHRLREAENKLNQHKQPPVDRSMDMHRWSTIIHAFVRQGQHKLSLEFERKKQLLKFDLNDHCLVQTFYNLKPTENQICSAKIIWLATRDKLQAEEEVAILKQRIYTKRLPSSFGILDHSIDHMETMLKQPALNQDKRATLSFRRLKTIAQFKYDMIVLTITTAEETVRSHTHLIADEKKKLIDTANGQVPLPKPLVQLMNAITARQTNMRQRHELILKQKLSVFDDAPMAINMAGAVGAME